MNSLIFRAFHKKKKQYFPVFSFCNDFIKVPQDSDSNPVRRYKRNEFQDIEQSSGLCCTKGLSKYIGSLIFEGDVFREDLVTTEISNSEFLYYVVIKHPQLACFMMIPIEHYSDIKNNGCVNKEQYKWIFEGCVTDFSKDILLYKIGTYHEGQYKHKL